MHHLPRLLFQVFASSVLSGQLLLLLVIPDGQVQAADMFPFGPDEGDIDIGSINDRVRLFPFDPNAPVADNTYSWLRVASNGFMHFEGILGSYNWANTMLPDSVQLIGLGVDVDTRDQGHVYVRSIDDPVQLQPLESEVHLVDPNFTPSMAWVATWWTVEGKHLPDELLNSFQVILLVDTELQKTFGILNYNRTDWITTSKVDGFEAGYNSGVPSTSFSLRGNMTEPEFMDFILSESNVGIPGKFILRIDGHPCVSYLRPEMAIDDGSWIHYLGWEPFVPLEQIVVKCRPSPHDWDETRNDLELQCWNSTVSRFNEDSRLATLPLTMHQGWDGQICVCEELSLSCDSIFSFKEELAVSCGGHICGPMAECINGTCVCTHERYDSGNGYMACHNDDHMSAFLVNDPTLHIWDNDHANLAVPCRYDITEVTTALMSNDGGAVGGSCRIHIKGFNRKHKGKFYVHGVDTAVSIEYDNGTSYEASIRKSGIAINGTYHFEINGTLGSYNPDGPFLDDDIPELCSVLDMFSIATLHVPACGVHVLFRPYDVILKRNQTRVPGVSVIVHTANAPHFVDNGAMLALLPRSQGDAPSSIAQLPPINIDVSYTNRIIFRALVSNVFQVNPTPNTACTDAGASLQLMMEDDTALAKALNSCVWMLLSPKFIRCYDASTNGQDIMELFNQCILVSKGDESCSSIQQAIEDSGCDTYDLNNALLQRFISSTSCDVDVMLN